MNYAANSTSKPKILCAQRLSEIATADDAELVDKIRIHLQNLLHPQLRVYPWMCPERMVDWFEMDDIVPLRLFSYSIFWSY